MMPYDFTTTTRTIKGLFLAGLVATSCGKAPGPKTEVDTKTETPTAEFEFVGDPVTIDWFCDECGPCPAPSVCVQADSKDCDPGVIYCMTEWDCHQSPGLCDKVGARSCP